MQPRKIRLDVYDDRETTIRLLAFAGLLGVVAIFWWLFGVLSVVVWLVWMVTMGWLVRFSRTYRVFGDMEELRRYVEEQCTKTK